MEELERNRVSSSEADRLFISKEQRLAIRIRIGTGMQFEQLFSKKLTEQDLRTLELLTYGHWFPTYIGARADTFKD